MYFPVQSGWSQCCSLEITLVSQAKELGATSSPWPDPLIARVCQPLLDFETQSAFNLRCKELLSLLSSPGLRSLPSLALVGHCPALYLRRWEGQNFIFVRAPSSSLYTFELHMDKEVVVKWRNTFFYTSPTILKQHIFAYDVVLSVGREIEVCKVSKVVRKQNWHAMRRKAGKCFSTLCLI